MSRIRSTLVAAVAVLSVLMSGGGIAVGGSDAGVPSVEAALLVAEDLPAGLESVGGVTDQPAFDYDEQAFEAAGGLEAVAQTWQAPEVDLDMPVVIVFDFRFRFPDEDAAAAYLDAAEPILSETITGITLQPGTPTIGDDLRHYAGNLSQGEVSVDIHNLLFRRGPVVAKVYIGGFGTTLTDARAIGLAASERIDTWLAAAPDPGVTTAPSPTGTAGPSHPPVTASPGTSPAASGTILSQWAADAIASSEYGDDSWSAMRATGEPDVDRYSDDTDAWAPASSSGTIEWLELRYAQPVLPAGVTIIESFGSGAVTQVEAFDAATDTWQVLWSGEDPSPPELVAFSPRIAAVDFATDRLRVTLDTDLVPGWNEIDAVELVGTIP